MPDQSQPGPTTLSSTPGHDVLYLLQSFATESVRYGEMVRRGHQLSRTDVHALNVVVEGHRLDREVTVTRLAEQLVLTVPATTATADRLVAQGFIERNRSDDDRRKVVLFPTERAVAIGREMFRPMSLELLGLMADMDPEELEAVRAFLPRAIRAIANSMPAVGDPAGTHR